MHKKTAAVVADPILSGENKEYNNYDNLRITSTRAKKKTQIKITPGMTITIRVNLRVNSLS